MSGNIKVEIANFGGQNYEWPICRGRGTVATMNAVEAQKYWDANDREGYVSSRMANDTTAAEKRQPRRQLPAGSSKTGLQTAPFSKQRLFV